MLSHKRTAHLLPAGIVGLGASIAIAVSMAGTAAAAPVQDFGTHDFRGIRDFRSAESDAGLAPVTAPVQDFGTKDFRGVRDFRSAESAAALSADAPSAPTITAALQPGQTDSFVTSGKVDSSIDGLTPWTPALGPTAALQPGQTDSVVYRVAGYDPAHEHLVSADGSGPIGGATGSTPALRPISAPQPGQTGW